MKVLLATDGKAPADNAAQLLAAVGDPGKIEVTVLSVAGFWTALEEGARTEQHYSPEAGRAHAAGIVERTLGFLRSRDLRAEGKISEGHPPMEILAEAESHELIFVGSGTETWLGQVVLGSVAIKVLHESSGPVVVCHEAPADARPTIIFGTDGSPDAMSALDVLIQLVDAPRMAVHVISVAPARDAATDRPDVNQSVSAAIEKLTEAGIEATSATLEGRPARSLLDAAQTHHAALVVVGARGLGSGRNLLGSVSDRIVRHAPATLVGPKKAPLGGELIAPGSSGTPSA